MRSQTEREMRRRKREEKKCAGVKEKMRIDWEREPVPVRVFERGENSQESGWWGGCPNDFRKMVYGIKKGKPFSKKL